MNMKMKFATSIAICIALCASCKKECDHPQPTASFDASSESALVNTKIEFTNTSSEANSYIWNFGNGTSSNDENTECTYSEPGVYRVELTAIGPGGYATAEKTIAITFENGIKDGVSIDGNKLTDTWDQTRAALGNRWAYTDPLNVDGEYYHMRIYEDLGINFHYVTF